MNTPTHEPVATLLRQEILDPLGLHDVVLQPEQRPTPDTAHGYISPDYFHEHDLWDGTGYVPDRAVASYLWTAGGIVASAPSVAKFGDAVIRGTLLDPAAQREMTSFAPTGAIGDYTAYALGLGQVSPDLWIAVGNTLGFVSTLAYLPARHITAAVLTNETGSTPATLNIAQVLIETAEHR